VLQGPVAFPPLVKRRQELPVEPSSWLRTRHSFAKWRAKSCARQAIGCWQQAMPPRAIAAIRGHANEVHLLLTDVVLPDRSGYDLARDIARSLGGCRTISISGYPENARLRKGQAFLSGDAGQNSRGGVAIARWSQPRSGAPPLVRRQDSHKIPLLWIIILIVVQNPSGPRIPSISTRAGIDASPGARNLCRYSRTAPGFGDNWG
jgi:CheY-like chemotaxis protein